MSTDQQAIQQGAQTVDIRRRRYRLATPLLGAGIVTAQARISLGPLFLAVAGLNQGGDPEIEQARRTGLIDQNIGRLDIAMNDQAVVGKLYRLADLAKQLQPCPQPKLLALAPGGDIQAPHVLHHQVGLTPRQGATVQETGDVGMTEISQHLALAPKTRMQISAQRQRHDLDHHRLFENLVAAAGQVDRAHAASGQQAVDGPRPHLLPGLETAGPQLCFNRSMDARRKLVVSLVGGKHGRYLGKQREVIGTGACQPGLALFFGLLQGGLEKRLNALPATGVDHRLRPSR